MRVLFLGLLFPFLFSNSSAQSAGASLNSLISSEYAFAKSASEIGTRDAFLKFIADDGILFRPNAVNGKNFLGKSPGRPGLLSWYPVEAGISNSGDMGFTTGPAEFRRNKDSAAVWFGNFATVWERQADGQWKFIIDFGNSCGKPETDLKGLAVSDAAGTRGSFSKKEPLKPEQLFTLDSEFNLVAEKIGAADTYLKFIDEKTRILRDGTQPVIGPEQVKKFFNRSDDKMNFKPAGGKISSSNDIGFTYGTLEVLNSGTKLSELFNYLRIYNKRGGRWILVVEVAGRIEKQ